MIQLTKKAHKELIQMSKLSIDPNSELEVVFKSKNSKQPFTRIDFENIFRRLTSLGLQQKEEQEQLDINIIDETKTNNRITIDNVGVIQKFCENNNINTIDDKFIGFMRKQRYSNVLGGKTNIIKPIYINDYNFKVNLNSEVKCTKEDIEKIKTNFNMKNKTFRLKKRYSFFSEDNLFRFDLSIVKTSKKNEKSGEYIYARDLRSSGLLDNVPLYEFEIEFIGNDKLKEKKKERSDILLNSFVNSIGIILQVLRNSYHIISNTEERQILHEYCCLVSGKKISMDDIYNRKNFIGPKNVSLEKMNVVEIDEDSTVFNIRKDYCVTEKADGERHLCFISKNKKIYLINNRFEVIYTGSMANNYTNTILDGELITRTKDNNTIFKYLIFDLYYIQGEDIRIRQLNRTQQDKDDKILESRIELLTKVLTHTTLKDSNS